MKKTKVPKAHVDEKIEGAKEVIKHLHALGLTHFAETIDDITTLLGWLRDGKIEVV